MTDGISGFAVYLTGGDYTPSQRVELAAEYRRALVEALEGEAAVLAAMHACGEASAAGAPFNDPAVDRWLRAKNDARLSALRLEKYSAGGEFEERLS